MRRWFLGGSEDRRRWVPKTTRERPQRPHGKLGDVRSAADRATPAYCRPRGCPSRRVFRGPASARTEKRPCAHRRASPESPQRQRISTRPRDPPLRTDPLELADEGHAKIDDGPTAVSAAATGSRPTHRTRRPPVVRYASDETHSPASAAVPSSRPPASPADRCYVVPSTSNLRLSVRSINQPAPSRTE